MTSADTEKRFYLVVCVPQRHLTVKYDSAFTLTANLNLSRKKFLNSKKSVKSTGQASFFLKSIALLLPLT